MCKVSAFFFLVISSSAFILALISIERLVFFLAPLRYDHYITIKRTVATLVVIWIISISLIIPPLVGYGDLIFSLSCGYIFLAPAHVERSLVFLPISLVILGGVAIVIIVTNLSIIFIAVRSAYKLKNMRVFPSVRVARKRSQNRRKLSIAITRKQLRFCQVFGSILLANLFTSIPAVVLGILITITRVVSVHFVTFVYVSMLSQVSGVLSLSL